MRSEPQTTIDPERMLAFASFVRDSPLVTPKEANVLATQFDLPVELVKDSLRVAEQSRPKAPQAPSIDSGRLRASISAGFRSLFGYVFERPVIAAAVCGALSGIGSSVAEMVISTASMAVTVASGIVSFLGLVIVNLIRGQVRYGVITAAVFVALSIGINAVADLLRNRALPESWELLALLLAVLVLTLLLGLLMSVVALVGGYMRAKREISQESKLDRLQLLQRVFDLQEQLSTSSNDQSVAPRRTWALAARERWPLVAVGAGVATGLFSVLQAITVGLPGDGTTPSVPSLLVGILTLGVSFASLPLVGFISGSFLRGVGAGLLLIGGQTVAQLLPVRGLGPSGLWTTYADSPEYFLVHILAIGVVALGGLGGTVEERRQHKARLAAQDQSTILSEIIRIQQVLQTGTADVCVMVVDCVQSTIMKSGADALKIEASFRAYQEYVSSAVRRHGGTVYSTAGDGVVAQFSGAPDAFAAARAIQTDMPTFNRTSNRLASPFRVRIGLHCGAIHGDLHKVGFSAVIDIAAHIEKEALGGIVVTEPFRSRILGERFAQLANEVDGQVIHIALNPTV